MPDGLFAGHVEYLRQVRAAAVAHGRVLVARRGLWRLLSHRPSSLPVLAMLKRMEATTKAADEAFKSLMERYPSAPTLMRAYGRFLEQVRRAVHEHGHGSCSCSQLFLAVCCCQPVSAVSAFWGFPAASPALVL